MFGCVGANLVPQIQTTRPAAIADTGGSQFPVQVTLFMKLTLQDAPQGPDSDANLGRDDADDGGGAGADEGSAGSDDGGDAGSDDGRGDASSDTSSDAGTSGVDPDNGEPWYALCLSLSPPAEAEEPAAGDEVSWRRQFPYDLCFLTDITFVPVSDLVCPVPVLPVLPGHGIVVKGPPSKLKDPAPVFVLSTIV